MWFRRRRSQQDFRNEIKSHLQLEIDRLKEEGLPADEARAIALRQFGNITSAEERFYERGRLLWLEHLWKDFAHAARALRRQPALVAVAAISLALGTGVNTAFVATIESVLFRPVTVSAPEELVTLWVGNSNRISEANYQSLREAGLELTGYRIHDELRFQKDGEPLFLAGQEVSPNYFEMLGIRVAMGSAITPDVLKRDRNSAVITDSFWRNALNSDRNVIGRSIRVSGKSYTIAGVLPPGFRSIWGGGISPQMYFVTGSALAQVTPDRTAGRHELIGRLSPGESVAQFRDRVLARAKALAQMFPEENRDLGRVKIWAFPKAGLLMREGSGMFAPLVLFGAVLFVLLGLVVAIACANVASIMLARAMNRQREISVRLAIGCGFGRLAQLLFAETFLLSALGAGLGALLGVWIARALSRISLPIPIPVDWSISLDWRFFGYLVALTVFATFVAGLAPVWQARRARPIAGLHGDHVKGGRTGRWNLRVVLVTAQVTTATVLLAGTGLFLRSLWSSMRVNPGFNMQHVATIELDLRSADLIGPDAARFEEQAIRRIGEIPGVISASAVAIVPLSMNSRQTSLEVEGAQTTDLSIWNNTVRPDYFRTMQIPVLQGREFTVQDLSRTEPVAIVNQTFARRVFGDSVAIGRRIRPPNDRKPEPWISIVGIVADSRYATLGEPPRPVVYWLRTASRRESMTLVARTQGAPDGLLPVLKSAIRDVDGRVLCRVRPMRSRLALALFPARAAAVLFGALALVALTLTITGLYGLITYTVSRRTPEIGVRMALGASETAVVRMVVADGLRVALVGLSLGILLALAGGGVLKSLLVGISSSDPISFGFAAGLLLLTAGLASYAPARRASRIDPIRSLRVD